MRRLVGAVAVAASGTDSKAVNNSAALEIFFFMVSLSQMQWASSASDW
jgi:hypothetical protein